MAKTEEILEERGARYGSFKNKSKIAQEIKKSMQSGPSYKGMSDDKKQAMEMFANKIARIVNGDPDYDDSWQDICGYSQLIINDLHEQENTLIHMEQ